MRFINFLTQHKYFYLLVSLLAFFIVRGVFIEPGEKIIVDIFFTINIMASVYAISSHKRVYLIICFILASISLLLTWVHDFIFALRNFIYLNDIVIVLLLSVIIAVIFYNTFKQTKISTETIYGAISGYVLLGFTWSFIYDAIYLYNSHAFLGIPAANIESNVSNFIYFSFVTLSTLGFGDIVPLTGFARTMSWYEAIAGQIYLTVMLAQIIGLYIAQKKYVNEDG
ncbi:MAG: ion channel [Gammaproteobacteria bacterium]